MNYIIRMLITAGAVLLCSYLMSGIHVDGFRTAIIVAIVLSLLNAFVKPLLVLLTIPITIFTLGLFLLFVNVIIIYITDSLIKGFRIDSIWWALGLSIILSFVNSSISNRVGNKSDR